MWYFGDHPRLRGEHNITNSQNNVIWGSPPPTRGTLSGAKRIKGKSGITPAYAGNTKGFLGLKKAQ